MKKRSLSAIICVVMLISALFALTSCANKEFEELEFKDATFMYDGFEHSITVTGVPEKATVKYSPSNVQSAAGTYKITATVSAEKYNTAVLTATLKIVYPDDYALDSDIAALLERLNNALADANTKNDEKISALKAEYQAKIDALIASNEATQSELDDLNTEYDAKVAELKAADKATNDALAELEAQYAENLAALNKADADNTAAIEALNKTYKDKVAELEAADKATNDALAELEAQYAEDLEALNKADADNTAAIEALNKTYTDKVAELEAADKATDDALAELEAQYAEDLEALKKADADNTSSIEALNKTYKDKVAELEAADKATDDALAELEAQYAEDLEALNKADADNTAAIEALNKTYTDKVAELDAADKATNDALDELEAQYAEDLAALNKADADNTAAIEALNKTYKDKVAELEAADKATNDALAELEAQYAEDLEALNKADADNTAAIEALNKTYTDKVAELEAADKATDDAIAELEAQYAEDLEALNKADADNTAAIEALNKTYTDKVAELEAADAATDDALAELEAQYAEDLAALNKANADNTAAIEALNKTYTDKVAELEAADKATNDALAELEAQYAEDLEALNKADADNTAAIEALNKTYTDKVAELEAADKATNDALAELEAQYAEDLAALNKADADNTAAIEALNKTYTDKVAELEAADAATDEALAELEAQYAEDLEALNKADADNTAAIEALNKTYTDKVAELEAADAATDEALADLEAQYAEDLAALNKADADNIAAIEALTKTYTDKVAELEAADAATDEALADLEAQYAEDLEALQQADADNTAAIEACESELQSKIDALTEKYDAKVESIEAMIAVLEATDADNADRISTLETQVNILLNPPTYTVTFDTVGAGDIEAQEVSHGEKLSAPTVPPKDGYIFDGWYFENEKWNFIGFVVTEDMTLTAKWHETYDFSDIHFDDASYTYDGVEKTIRISGELPDGLVVTYTSNKLTDAGETLAYAHIMDESGYIYTTLTAVLTIEKATLSFTMDDLETIYDATAKSIYVNEAIPEGVKVFYDNNTQTNAGTYEVVARVVVNGNYNEVDNVSATLTIQKATPNVTVSHNESDLILGMTPTLEVEGDVTGTATLVSGQTLTLGTRAYNYIFVPNDSNYNSVSGKVNITVLAKVEFYDLDGELLDIQYVEKGGCLEDFTPVYTDESGYSYTFAGWKMQSGYFDATSPVYANMTLTAEYTTELIEYTVTYNLDGGTTAEALTEEYTVLDSFVVPTLSKVGYTFLGWSGDCDEGTLSFEVSESIGNKTYTAVFSPNTYSVTFNPKGGSCDTLNMEVVYDSEISLPTPTLFGYDFIGWYYGGQLIESGVWNYSSNVSLEAKWEASEIIYISTADELSYVAYSLDGNYLLTNDIDLGGVEWSVIGDTTLPFSGTFDGNGYTISNFTISVTADYTGFFGANSGIIRNLNVSDATVTSGTTGAAILVGYNSGTIYNCSTSGNISKENTYIGGVAAYSEGDVISSSSSVSVSSSSIYVGVLVGYVNSSKVDRCFTDGSISISNPKYHPHVGGLVGYAYNFEIMDCYSESAIVIDSDARLITITAGGLMGTAEGTSEIPSILERSYSTGSISVDIYGANTAGGDINYNGYVGGVVGTSSYTSYATCYSTGSATLSIDMPTSSTYTLNSSDSSYYSNASIGGFVGKDTGSIYTNCYASVDISNKSASRTYFYSYKNSYSYTEIIHYAYAYTYAGGFAGMIGGTQISNCYSASSIDSTTKATATYGSSQYYCMNSSYAYSYVGGLVGKSESTSEIANSYAAITDMNVSVSATAYPTSTASTRNYYGGLCGSSGYITATNCYRYSGTSSNVTTGTATVITNFKSVNFITGTLGWNPEVWILENGAFPTLDLSGRYYSDGLEFALNVDGKSYSVTGMGTCTDTDIVIPYNYNGLPVTIIGSKAFCDCTTLTSVTIPDSVTSIGDNAFNNCNSLTNVIVGNNVTNIGSHAFALCSNLISITMYDSVASIDYNAIYNCMNLTSINFVGTIEQWNAIDKTLGWDTTTISYIIYCTDGEIAKDGTVTYN